MSSPSPKPLKIALLGGRGIPARYGGYETLMEEVAPRLADRGLDVTVYCRSHYTPRSLEDYRGVRLVVLPTIRTKHLDTPVHTLLSCLHAIFGRFDAVLLVNAANAAFIPLLRATRTPVALHVDGIEQQRAKWGWLGRKVYTISEYLATRLPSVLVTDAAVIRDHYRDRHGASSTLIRYGVDPQPLPAGETLEKLDLESRRFILYVSRFEPENNPHQVVEAYKSVKGDLPLVMVGDAPYASRYIESFEKAADPRTVFPGALYGEAYRELLSHALAYVQATEVGGTHPALVEAMGYGNCLVVNDTPENREVAGEDAIYFTARDPRSLTEALQRVLDEPELADSMRNAAKERARRFSWSHISDDYESLFTKLADRT